ncbi:Sterigmatocystin biosynthesis regulatory protein [Madurella mycetomatis]|uniref:Sterigmatocystin biosynthesis regulatory protein n=1 Tax=Madurella mycetomatis TaxID=100816 RepID=A0A175VY96_9PEZI|nr:Sterigmatocystin biosynthesis regulatory protein [Madurella mycetomatis]KXX82969.1 Sterigmatocystin biosynthesis regulatory protein [Madurella mycetomatis]
MVGVPGRSKACLTCRRRKKGCNLEKPTCGQCKKAGLTCEGYSTQAVFVVSTPRNRQIGYSVPISSRTSESSWQRTRRNTVSSDMTTHRLLARPEAERRCIDLFWEVYFPSGRPIPPSAARSYTCTWTETARSLYREDSSLRYALGANCLLITGRRHQATWMLREGARLYGKALADLRRSLGASQGPRRDALIATVKLLCMFEAFSQQGDGGVADEPQDWQRHIAGELALFIARTPAAHIDGDAHHVFADERVEMALSAVLRRKRLVLSNAEWKSIPWQEIPKNLKDILVDVLVDMPGLVEDFDNMRLCTDANKQAALRLELVQKCWDHDRQLLAWLDLLRQVVEDLVIHVAQVHGMSLFWTTSLILYSIFRMASEPQADLPERTDPTYYACKLAEAITILLHPRAGLYGQQSAALPLEVALQYITRALSSSSHEREALLKTLETLKDDLGNGLTRMISASADHRERTGAEQNKDAES